MPTQLEPWQRRSEVGVFFRNFNGCGVLLGLLRPIVLKKAVALDGQGETARLNDYLGKFCLYSCAAQLSRSVFAMPQLYFLRNQPLVPTGLLTKRMLFKCTKYLVCFPCLVAKQLKYGLAFERVKLF